MQDVRHMQSMKNMKIMQIQTCKTAPFTQSAEAIKGLWYYLFLFLIYSPGETSEVYGDMVIVSKYKRSTWSVFCVQGDYENFNADPWEI